MRITIEQLNELTVGQKEKLRKWWQPKDGDWFYGSYGERGKIKEWIISPYCVDSGVYGASLDPTEDATPDKNAIPLLSIGQMIEILHQTKFINISNAVFEKGYVLQVISPGASGKVEVMEYRSEELVYALWLALKSIL